MNHPEGRVLAIQQQIFFAKILSEKMELDVANVLRKLALSGLSLVTDTNEHTVDAAAIYPSIYDTEPALKLVKEES